MDQRNQEERKAIGQTVPQPLTPLGNNPLANIDDGLQPRTKASSSDLIRESIMRGGGEPFGPPLGLGLTSLTMRVVRLLKFATFFGFETFEQKSKRNKNKFTRYAAARYRGSYDKDAVREHARKEKRSEKKRKRWLFW